MSPNSSIQPEWPDRTASFNALFGPNISYPYLRWVKGLDVFSQGNVLTFQTASLHAELSMLSYVKDLDWIAAQTNPAGLHLQSHFEGSGLRCIHFLYKGGSIFCFRGTEIDSLRNILTDLHLTLGSWKQGGKIHSGFHSAWETISAWFQEELITHRVTKVHLTGHSLGGALALLGAETCQALSPVVYTFGAPRVGDADFAESVQATHFRMVNNNDLVPQMPPGPIYQHDSSCHFIGSNGSFQIKPDVTAMIRENLKGHLHHALDVFKSWSERKVTAVPTANLVDHAPCFYIKSLRKLARID
ncbi:lipase family protein [Verrucomicrobia bacterium]|nr:lipase family protein [Verrucomicrobiota bacterium]